MLLFMASEEILQIIKAEAWASALQRMLRHSGIVLQNQSVIFGKICVKNNLRKSEFISG